MFASSGDAYKGYRQIGHLRLHANVDTFCLSPKLRVAIAEFEGHFGRKVVVNSGYRNPFHNSKVGGADQSFHMKCMAADIFIPGVPKSKLIAFAMRTGSVGGLGCIPIAFIHADVRDRPRGWRKPVTFRLRARRSTQRSTIAIATAVSMLLPMSRHQMTSSAASSTCPRTNHWFKLRSRNPRSKIYPRPPRAAIIPNSRHPSPRRTSKTLALTRSPHTTPALAPFVYRRGRHPFTVQRGVRLLGAPFPPLRPAVGAGRLRCSA